MQFWREPLSRFPQKRSESLASKVETASVRIQKRVQQLDPRSSLENTMEIQTAAVFRFRRPPPLTHIFIATAGRNLFSCLDLGDRTDRTDRPTRPVTKKNVGSLRVWLPRFQMQTFYGCGFYVKDNWKTYFVVNTLAASFWSAS